MTRVSWSRMYTLPPTPWSVSIRSPTNSTWLEGVDLWYNSQQSERAQEVEMQNIRKKYAGERRTPPLLCSQLVGVAEELVTEAGARSPEQDMLFLQTHILLWFYHSFEEHLGSSTSLQSFSLPLPTQPWPAHKLELFLSKLCCKKLASPVWRVVTKPAWRWLLWVGGSRYISSTTTMPPAFSSNHLCTLAKFWGKTVIYDSASFLQNIINQMFNSCIVERFNNELIALACWSAVHFASISHIQCCWVSLSMENSTFKNETVFS